MKFTEYFKCKIGHHKYYFISELSLYALKIGCESCGKVFAMYNEPGFECILEWDSDLEELYEIIGS